MKEHSLCYELLRTPPPFPPTTPPNVGTSLCDCHFNYGKLFFFPFLQLQRVWFLLGFVPASLKCYIALTCSVNLS